LQRDHTESAGPRNCGKGIRSDRCMVENWCEMEFRTGTPDGWRFKADAGIEGFAGEALQGHQHCAVS